jgi:hypothetical protein
LHEEGQPLKLSVGVSGRVERLQRPTTVLLNAWRQPSKRWLEVLIVPAGADPTATIA